MRTGLGWLVALLLCALFLVSCAPRGGQTSLDVKRESRPARDATAREARSSGEAGITPVEGERFAYVCPDHPEVQQDTPGVCPQDGKFLVAQAPERATVRYQCPVHPEVSSDQPGKCTQCGRFLEARTVAGKAPQ